MTCAANAKIAGAPAEPQIQFTPVWRSLSSWVAVGQRRCTQQLDGIADAIVTIRYLIGIDVSAPTSVGGAGSAASNGANPDPASTPPTPARNRASTAGVGRSTVNSASRKALTTSMTNE
jgi:hypothetical protein